MNQILSVDNGIKEKKKKVKKDKINYSNSGGPIEIEKILKFFSITILIFGFFLVGSGSYSMFIDNQKNNNSEPVIYLEKTGENELMIKIIHNKPLSKVAYSWNEEDEEIFPTNGEKEMTKTINIPSGTNVLNVYVLDSNNVEKTQSQTFTVEGDIKIDIKPNGTKLKITAEGENNLKYMTYQWDDEEEIKVDINDIKIDQTIEIPKGEHNLTVIVVDEQNITEKQEQPVVGVTKPKVEVTTDGSEFIIKAEDDQGIKTIRYTLNNKKSVIKLDKYYALEDRKEFEYPIPLVEGENKIQVTVYNENDVTETSKTYKISK